MLEDVAQDSTNLLQYNNVNLLSRKPSHARGQNKTARWIKRFESYCGARNPINQCLNNATISIETKCKNSKSQLVPCGNPPSSSLQQIRILTIDVQTTKGSTGNLNAQVTRTFNAQWTRHEPHWSINWCNDCLTGACCLLRLIHCRYRLLPVSYTHLTLPTNREV